MATWLVVGAAAASLKLDRTFRNDPWLWSGDRHHHQGSLGPGRTMLTLMGVALLTRCLRGNSTWRRVN